jgi:hypothetical protein
MTKDEYYYPKIEIKNGWTLEMWPGLTDHYNPESFEYYNGLLIGDTEQIAKCEKVLPELANLIDNWLLPAHDVKFYLDGFEYPFIINHKETHFLPEENKVIVCLGSKNFEQ